MIGTGIVVTQPRLAENRLGYYYMSSMCGPEDLCSNNKPTTRWQSDHRLVWRLESMVPWNGGCVRHLSPSSPSCLEFVQTVGGQSACLVLCTLSKRLPYRCTNFLAKQARIDCQAHPPTVRAEFQRPHFSLITTTTTILASRPILLTGVAPDGPKLYSVLV